MLNHIPSDRARQHTSRGAQQSTPGRMAEVRARTAAEQRSTQTAVVCTADLARVGLGAVLLMLLLRGVTVLLTAGTTVLLVLRLALAVVLLLLLRGIRRVTAVVLVTAAAVGRRLAVLLLLGRRTAWVAAVMLLRSAVVLLLLVLGRRVGALVRVLLLLGRSTVGRGLTVWGVRLLLHVKFCQSDIPKGWGNGEISVETDLLVALLRGWLAVVLLLIVTAAAAMLVVVILRGHDDVMCRKKRFILVKMLSRRYSERAVSRLMWMGRICCVWRNRGGVDVAVKGKISLESSGGEGTMMRAKEPLLKHRGSANAST
jgi:lysylphosphatidylglycerol synthetase-like protein (DUF2156 family)